VNSSLPETLPRYSYSQVNAWQSCNTRWRWNYHRQLVPAKTKTFFQVGTLLHEFLDDFYREFPDLDWPKFSLRIADIFNNSAVTLDDAALYSLCTKIMKRYIEQWSPREDQGITVLATEFIVEEVLTTPMGRQFIFEGYIDLMMQQKGLIYVVDHKSSAATKFWGDKDYQTLPQMLLYKAVLERRGFKVDRLLYNHINTYTYADYYAQPLDKVFKRKVLIRGPVEVQNVLQNFCIAVDEIEEKREKAKGHPLHVVKNYGSHCSKCAYQQLCVLEMKSISTESTVNTYFKKREPRPTDPSGFTPDEEGDGLTDS